MGINVNHFLCSAFCTFEAQEPDGFQSDCLLLWLFLHGCKKEKEKNPGVRVMLNYTGLAMKMGDQCNEIILLPLCSSNLALIVADLWWFLNIVEARYNKKKCQYWEMIFLCTPALGCFLFCFSESSLGLFVNIYLSYLYPPFHQRPQGDAVFYFHMILVTQVIGDWWVSWKSQDLNSGLMGIICCSIIGLTCFSSELLLFVITNYMLYMFFIVCLYMFVLYVYICIINYGHRMAIILW